MLQYDRIVEEGNNKDKKPVPPNNIRRPKPTKKDEEGNYDQN
jgi:hypothetical protein